MIVIEFLPFKRKKISPGAPPRFPPLHVCTALQGLVCAANDRRYFPKLQLNFFLVQSPWQTGINHNKFWQSVVTWQHIERTSHTGRVVQCYVPPSQPFKSLMQSPERFHNTVILNCSSWHQRFACRQCRVDSAYSTRLGKLVLPNLSFRKNFLVALQSY